MSSPNRPGFGLSRRARITLVALVAGNSNSSSGSSRSRSSHDDARREFHPSVPVGKRDRTSRRPFRNTAGRIHGHIPPRATVLPGREIQQAAGQDRGRGQDRFDYR